MTQNPFLAISTNLIKVAEIVGEIVTDVAAVAEAQRPKPMGAQAPPCDHVQTSIKWVDGEYPVCEGCGTDLTAAEWERLADLRSTAKRSNRPTSKEDVYLTVGDCDAYGNMLGWDYPRRQLAGKLAVQVPRHVLERLLDNP